MKFSIITPNFNGARFLEEALASVAAQRCAGVEVEHWIMDGGSTDGSPAVIQRFLGADTRLVTGPDGGPAAAINNGLSRATGDVLGWLNADDRYHPGALGRVAAVLRAQPRCAWCFGACRMVNEAGAEIRRSITRFKELFFPLSARGTFQCINYISQPAMFFRRSALAQAGGLREDLAAAFDYEFMLRLWRCGGAARVPGAPLADFRWHPGSISGQTYRRQFREEWQAAVADAGRFSPQAVLHLGVRFGIVGAYTLMARRRERGTLKVESEKGKDG